MSNKKTYMETIINALKNKKLSNGKLKLSESSINLYIRNIERLNNNQEIRKQSDLLFLENIDEIKNKINNYKANTQRQYLISIVNILDVTKGTNKKLNDTYDKYHDLMMHKAKEIEEIPSDTMNENQEKNWATWDEIKDVYKRAYERVLHFIKLKSLNETQYKQLLETFILSLYIFNYPRRNADYSNMNIKKSNNNLLDNINYLIYDDNEFIFNDYKTDKKYGEKIIKFNEEQKDILKIYLKHHPLIKNKIINGLDVPLLVYSDGKPLTQVNSITRILNSLFKRFIKKSIGSSLLRHIYITYNLGDSIKKIEEAADGMAHSVDQQKKYIKKKPESEIEL